MTADLRFNGAFARKNHSDLNKVANSRKFRPKAGSRRNQHALRAASPRTPTPMLLAVLRACSFRLESEAVAWRFPLGAWLGRSATSCGPPCSPPSESLRLPSPTSQPKRLVNEERRFHSETAGASV